VTTEELIARACKPQVGDTYKRGAYGARVVAVHSAYVRCVQPSGVEFDTDAQDWARLCKNTIFNGAKFTPEKVTP
jgi:hypothetical protein